MTEDELMELLNKAWEDGREAAEKRLAYERKQMEERWKVNSSVFRALFFISTFVLVREYPLL